jgi:hypothetical protein
MNNLSVVAEIGERSNQVGKCVSYFRQAEPTRYCALKKQGDAYRMPHLMALN